MIRSHTKRAVLINMLSEEQMHRLHGIENERGFAIPAWNVLELFNLPTCREYYNLPTEHHEVTAWMESVSKQISALAILRPSDIYPIEDGRIEELHTFDIIVSSRRGEIRFDGEDRDDRRTSGVGRRQRDGRLRDIIKAKEAKDIEDTTLL